MDRAAIAEILNHPTSRELLHRDLTRLAYVATDGPRARSRLPAPGTAPRSCSAPPPTPRS